MCHLFNYNPRQCHNASPCNNLCILYIAVSLRPRGRLKCCGWATILFNTFVFSKIEHAAKTEHNKSSSESLPVLVWPSCSVANKVWTYSDLNQPSCSLANKVCMHQHAGAVFYDSILQCCCLKLAIAYSVIFYSLIHCHHQKATIAFSIHQDMDKEDNTLRPGVGGSSAQYPPVLYGIWNG